MATKKKAKSTVKHVPFSKIEFKDSICPRIKIDKDTVQSYAEEMTHGTKFPEVVLALEDKKYYIADGWHRLKAYELNEAVTIPAEVIDGGKDAAVKYALGANQMHGLRRTNEDKRRCVDLALKQFSSLSNRQISEICGVHHQTVSERRNNVDKTATSRPATRTDSRGREQPVKKKVARKTTGASPSKPTAPAPPPPPNTDGENVDATSWEEVEAKAKTYIGERETSQGVGMHNAKTSVTFLNRIPVDDPEYKSALEYVKAWIDKRLDAANES